MALSDIRTLTAAMLEQWTLPDGTKAIKHAYPYMPTSMPSEIMPCVIIHPVPDDSTSQPWPRPPMQKEYTYQLFLDLYVQPGSDLAAADQLLTPFDTSLFDWFNQHIQMNDPSIVQNSAITKSQYGGFTYAGVTYLGIRFTLVAVEFTPFIYHS